MSPFIKIALVLVGYLAAGLVAALVVIAHDALYPGTGSGADGMHAFGDLLLFITVFAVVGMLPTGAAIYFFRTRRSNGALRASSRR
jgi:hypothetical protein